jgi:hypothetical protein
MRQHSARRIKKQKKTRELAGSSQKKITKIGRNKFSLFWKAMDKNLCKQKEKKKIEDKSWTCRIQQKLQKSEDKRQHFLAFFKNPAFPYKRKRHQ